MSERATVEQVIPAERRLRPMTPAAIVVGLVGLGLFAGAGLLWLRHGGTVFMEMLAAGLAACF